MFAPLPSVEAHSPTAPGSTAGVSATTSAMLKAQHPAVRSLLLFSWLLTAVFLFGLPWWSHHLNDSYGDYRPATGLPGGLCTIPPAEVTCSNGANATALLLHTSRKFVCGCGQGILGEGLCPIDGTGYSISGFIATGPGTGAMMMSTFLPILGMWFTQQIAREMLGQTLLVCIADVSLVAAQFLYLCFLIFSTCIFPYSHAAVVTGFLGAAVVHYAVLALATLKVLRSKSSCARIIFIGVVGGLVSIAAGGLATLLYVNGLIRWPYGFWLGECCGLLCGFGISPALLHLVPVHDDILRTREPVTGGAEACERPSPTALPTLLQNVAAGGSTPLKQGA